MGEEMTRIEFIKESRVSIFILVFFTLMLPFIKDWHNPAGVQPFTAFAGLCVLGWFSIIAILMTAKTDTIHQDTRHTDQDRSHP
jgi:uncharacterized membrane protein